MAAFLVNLGGATVDVDEAVAEALLAEGFRPATPDEVRAWYAGQGLVDPTAPTTTTTTTTSTPGAPPPAAPTAPAAAGTAKRGPKNKA